MKNNFNYIQMQAYVRPKQHKNLLELKKQLLEDYHVNISVAQLLRDSIDMFIDKAEKEGLKYYLERKGW